MKTFRNLVVLTVAIVVPFWLIGEAIAGPAFWPPAPVSNASVFADGGLSGSGTAGQIAYWDTASHITGDSQMTYSGGVETVQGVLVTGLTASKPVFTDSSKNLTSTGVVPIANGGTNSAVAMSGNSIMISNGSAIIQGAAGTTSTVLHGNAAGSPSYSAVSLTADITGTLVVANGGMGSSSHTPYAILTGGINPTDAVASLASIGTTTTLLHGNASGWPTFSAVSLSADVTGTLPIANGGTNSSTALSGSTIMLSNGTSIVQGTAGTTTTLLHGNAAGAPTYSAVDMTADVTGTLPVGNGGTNKTSFTAYAPIVGGTTTTGALQSVAGCTTGQVLSCASNGAAVPSWATAAAGTVTGSGAANKVAYWSSSSAQTSATNFGFDGTNLSIGSTTFGSLLNVGSSAQFQVDTNGKVYVPAGTNSAPSYTINGDSNSGIYQIGDGNWGFSSQGTKVMEWGDGYLKVNPGAKSNAQTTLTVTAPASTSLNTTAENIAIDLDMSASVTWAVGAIAGQRYMFVRNPTMGFTTSSATVTYADTVNIQGAPKAGAGVTITNSNALHIAGTTTVTTGTTTTANSLYIDPPTGGGTNYSVNVSSGNVLLGGLTASRTVFTDSNKVLTNTPPSANVGTCTLNGGTPPTCTATVASGCRPICGFGSIPGAEAVGCTVSGTTLTATGTLTASTSVVNFVCF